MPMIPPSHFFGYGSLVNRDTHGFADVHPARLRGWRRAWRHTTLREVAYLTVVPDPDCTIEGMVAEVPGQDWHALDQREAAYDRVSAAHQVDHRLPHRPEIALYTIPDGRHGTPGRSAPVLLSYIDVVVQGYLRSFGAAGAQRFFDTTRGWDATVLDDRAAPRYPRHCRLNTAERTLVDICLDDLGVRPVPPAG